MLKFRLLKAADQPVVLPALTRQYLVQ